VKITTLLLILLVLGCGGSSSAPGAGEGHPLPYPCDLKSMIDSGMPYRVNNSNWRAWPTFTLRDGGIVCYSPDGVVWEDTCGVELLLACLSPTEFTWCPLNTKLLEDIDRTQNKIRTFCVRQ